MSDDPLGLLDDEDEGEYTPDYEYLLQERKKITRGRLKGMTPEDLAMGANLVSLAELYPEPMRTNVYRYMGFRSRPAEELIKYILQYAPRQAVLPGVRGLRLEW